MWINPCYTTEPFNIEGNAESARVMGLMPWMDYEFQVIASNILGSGEPSMPSHTIRTQQAGEAPQVASRLHTHSLKTNGKWSRAVVLHFTFFSLAQSSKWVRNLLAWSFFTYPYANCYQVTTKAKVDVTYLILAALLSNCPIHSWSCTYILQQHPTKLLFPG